MSTPEAASATFAFVLLGLGLLVIGLCRAAARADQAAQQRTVPRDSYEGPDSLRLMQDLDAHLDAYEASVSGLYEPTAAAVDEGLTGLFERLGPPVYDPALDEGCERLWDAIRDSNTTEGDQSS